MPHVLDDSFWARVDKTPGCWIWTGARTLAGYGRFRRGRRSVYVHRAVIAAEHGEIPTGLSVLHHCDNPPCVRPDHLFLGTQHDNMADAAHKGRMHPGEANGMARLTRQEIRAIRLSNEPQKTVATRYGVSQGHVSRIRSGEAWGGIQ